MSALSTEFYRISEVSNPTNLVPLLSCFFLLIVSFNISPIAGNCPSASAVLFGITTAFAFELANSEKAFVFKSIKYFSSASFKAALIVWTLQASASA